MSISKSRNEITNYYPIRLLDIAIRSCVIFTNIFRIFRAPPIAKSVFLHFRESSRTLNPLQRSDLPETSRLASDSPTLFAGHSLGVRNVPSVVSSLSTVVITHGGEKKRKLRFFPTEATFVRVGVVLCNVLKNKLEMPVLAEFRKALRCSSFTRTRVRANS